MRSRPTPNGQATGQVATDGTATGARRTRVVTTGLVTGGETQIVRGLRAGEQRGDRRCRPSRASRGIAPAAAARRRCGWLHGWLRRVRRRGRTGAGGADAVTELESPSGGPGAAVPVIDLSDVGKVYDTGAIAVGRAGRRDAAHRRGRVRRDDGTVGFGKSTLMHILGCLDMPTTGTYRLVGHDVGQLGRGPPGRGAQPVRGLRVPAVQPAAVDDARCATSSCR